MNIRIRFEDGTEVVTTLAQFAIDNADDMPDAEEIIADHLYDHDEYYGGGGAGVGFTISHA